ncbi:uncharacterized protein LOC123208670 [Mangifera indica]|uniref:uncharacterized protein LOC123208670 n=1 Tax=Mangifera indica TaxID=29780 RepID=UPI001CFB9AA4|nr:uncharacterized protein LOC123208670 [Mangifera indica]
MEALPSHNSSPLLTFKAGTARSPLRGLSKIYFIIVQLKITQKTSVKAKENEKERSFLVEYLMNSCGLSLESAISAAKTYKLKNTETAASVLRLLRGHGFTNNQVSKIIRMFPRVISYNPEAAILPNIQFFRSIGLSRKDLPHLILKCPILLVKSLGNRIVPNYNCLKNVGGLDEKVVRALKGNYQLLQLM